MSENKMANVTVEELQKALPSRKNTITEEIAEVFRQSAKEPEFQGADLLTTALSYQDVMERSKVGIKDYLRAIR